MPGARTAGIAGLYAVTPEASDAVEKVRLALEGGALGRHERQVERVLGSVGHRSP